MLDRSRENSKDEHMHLSDAVLESDILYIIYIWYLQYVAVAVRTLLKEIATVASARETCGAKWGRLAKSTPTASSSTINAQHNSATREEARFRKAEWDNYLRHGPRAQAEYHHGFEHCIW